MLMVDGTEKMGANLRNVMEKSRNLEEVVIFIDEFEEIAGSRDEASRVDKSITNEFLKQVPLLKTRGTISSSFAPRIISDSLMAPCFVREDLIVLFRWEV